MRKINKNICLIILLIVLTTIAHSQTTKYNETASLLIYDLTKTQYYAGDTITFTMKNKTNAEMIYTIEIDALNNTSEDLAFAYSAYINNDTAFMNEPKNYKKGRKPSPNTYIVLRPFSIQPNIQQTSNFIVPGVTSKKGNLVRFRIEPDIRYMKESGTVYSNPFYIFSTL